jgi:hypothetical protein
LKVHSPPVGRLPDSSPPYPIKGTKILTALHHIHSLPQAPLVCASNSTPSSSSLYHHSSLSPSQFPHTATIRRPWWGTWHPPLSPHAATVSRCALEQMRRPTPVSSTITASLGPSQTRGPPTHPKSTTSCNLPWSFQYGNNSKFHWKSRKLTNNPLSFTKKNFKSLSSNKT